MTHDPAQGTEYIPLKTYPTHPGSRYPFGARPDPGGINFSVFSRHATAVALLLFEHPESPGPFQVIELDPERHRTFFAWHVYVQGLPADSCYAWRVDGPNDTSRSGFRFDRDKVLLDPWARAVTDALWRRSAARGAGDNAATSLRALAVNDAYDWEGDEPLNHHPEHRIIYELHVGGFTRHPSSAVDQAGRYAGIIEKIPYLQALGITDVELMPVMAFDEQDVPDGVAALGLSNYWGYSPHSYYSPHPDYCTDPDAGSQRREFRDMVKALHKAGIGVILDVVFNHTAEGDAEGPTINFKGLGNEIFYHLDPKDRRIYRDYTACGNTVNCNHPLVTRFLVECLEYWVREMHVDGFRFDLASVLARGEDGNPLYHAPVLWSIEFSDVLAHTALIAEAWDAGGLYQVGDFPGYRWEEWNGRYRDVMRRFVRGDRGLTDEVATRITGSSDLYQRQGRLPINSINFITCHDGFTLNDLVSYNEKHNENNGEDNRDGADHNYSWNCGTEGDTDDPRILELRRRQMKNFMAILLLSQGVPMILFGDELRRSQRGNNNSYCQDNELGWLDWGLLEPNRDMFRFVAEMIALRRRHPCLMRRRFLNGTKPEGARLPDISWHGRELHKPLWGDPEAQILAFTLGANGAEEEDLHVLLNMSEQALTIPLPPVEERLWHRALDTFLASPEDILRADQQTPMTDPHYPVQPRSIVVFESRQR